MKLSNKIIIGIACAMGIFTYARYDVWALEQAHRNSGREAACEFKKLEQQWAVCRYGAGGSIWVKYQDGWAAANGKALARARALASKPNPGGPALYEKGAGAQIPERIRAML